MGNSAPSFEGASCSSFPIAEGVEDEEPRVTSPSKDEFQSVMAS